MKIIIELKGTATLERVNEFAEILNISTQNSFADVIADIKKEC